MAPLQPPDFEFEGEFEIHLTIAALDDAALLEAARFAQARSLKFAHIVLPRGAVASQPMLSWRARGAFEAQLRSAAVVADDLRAADIDVVRIKIEAAPTNPDVPQFGACVRPEHYLECHCKFLLDERADIEALAALVMAHGGHLSRNARRVRADGCQERFATLRRRDGGVDGIAHDAMALRDAMTPYVREVLSSEIEYVVYDSNLAIDAGWLPGDAR
ncbi:MAG: hypothetical protein E6Q50_08790 [Lysobacter sp.]|nr:MAG: hypothetical protein E6Q50_08790 [Lysobacter sp.]